MGILELTKRAATEFARRHQYLIAGPWVHIPWGERVGSQNFGVEALLDTDAVLLRWFNHWLKESGNLPLSRASVILRSEKTHGAAQRNGRTRGA